MAKKIELLHTTYGESGNIESQEVVHPLTSPDCIIMENGKTLDEVMGDGIATPTLTHEGTSFKVGVGDSNIEVVDGDVAGMTLKGQSYQNILPKPTTLIMETDEKEFKINDKIDSNIIIDDNIAEIATVKGKTIVNAVQEESDSEYTVLGEDLSGQSITHVKETPTLEGSTLLNILSNKYSYCNLPLASEVILDSSIEIYDDERNRVREIRVTSNLQPGRKYILFANITTLPDGKSIGGLTTSIEGVQDYVIPRFNAIGKQSKIFEVKAESNVIALYMDANTTSYVAKMKQLMLFEYQEGMENWDIPYFEGEKYFESNIKGVTLQGQTLVNTIQEPCKDDYVVLGAEDGIEISAETGGHGTIEDTIDGSIKSAILKGQTLKAITDGRFDRSGTTRYPQGYQTDESVATFEDCGTYYKSTIKKLGTINVNGEDSPSRTNLSFCETITNNPIEIEKGKTYTLYIPRVDNSSYEKELILRDGGQAHNYTPIWSDQEYFVFTAIYDCTQIMIYQQFVIPESERGKTVSINVSKRAIIVEGDHRNGKIPPSIGVGLHSAKMPVLTTTGKNLCNNNFINSNQGRINEGYGGVYRDNSLKPSVYVSDYINVKGLDYITYNRHWGLNQNGTDNVQSYAFYDKNKKYITGSYNSTTLAVPSNAHYFRITIDSEQEFQLEQGTVATSYEPHKSNILTVNEEVELSGIGDVKDELNLLTGKLTQRIGEVVLDGNKEWSSNALLNNGIMVYMCQSYTNGKIVTDNVVSSTLPFYNLDYLKGLATLDGLTDAFITTITSTGKINLAFKKPFSDLNQLKQYLSQNPITVQYELETPVVKKVDLTVTDQDNNTIPHIQTQPTVTHITASSDYLIPTVTIDNNLSYETIIKPSTLYTVRFTRNTINADNPLTVDLGGTVQTVTSTEFTITTPSELTHNQLVFSGKNNVVSEVQVIEGDVTNIEYPFFEGMNDVKSPKMYVTGKNLFNINGEQHPNGTAFSYTITDNKIIVSGNGVDGSAHKWNNIGISVDNLIKGNKYTFTANISTDIENGYSLISLYNKNIGGFLDSFSSSSISYTFTAQDTGIIVRYFATNESDKVFNQTTTYYNIQLEEGTTATPYEPYYETIVQQDIDSIPLTSDMFEQGKRERGLGMSMQQCALTSNSARISSKTLIPVKPNSKYVAQGINTSVNHIWADMYDKDGLVCYNNVLDMTAGVTTGVVIPHDVHYLLIQLKNADESAISPSTLDSLNLILQEVPQEIVLRGIGDVKDELDLTRGEYIQRIGEAVLDGSSDENWVIVTSTTSVNEVTTLIGIYGLNDAKPENTNDATAVANNMVANNYAIKNIFGAKHTTEGCTLHMDNSLNRGHLMVRTKMLLANAQQWEDYLQTNPLVVQYELATPIIHKVNLTNTKVIPSYATETHYETITPSDSLIPNIIIPSTLNYNVAIKPSTKYTIRANTSDNLTVDLGGTTGTLSNGKVTLTTPTTLTHNEVKFSGTGKVKELMVVEGSEIKDNVPFFNGMKNVEMGGIKLVNIARGATYNNLVTANTNKTQFTYTSDGTGWGYIMFDMALLKPSTEYTIILKIVKNESNTTPPIKAILGNATNNFTNIDGIGLKKIKYITPSEDNFDVSYKEMFSIGFRPCTSGQQIIIQNPMIIEGDWTHLDEIPFIESEMIIDQPIIRSQGKNLLDLESKPFTVASAGTTFTKSGNTYTVTTLANSEAYDYIRMTWTVDNDKWVRDVIGKQLTLSVSSLECTNKNSTARLQLRIECYDGTRQYVAIALGEKGRTFTMPTNTKDLQLQIMTNNSSSVLTEDTTITVSNIRLELGNTATSYEPYKHQTLYSNRVIGYEDGCYYGTTGIKITDTTQCAVLADVEGLSIAYVTNGGSNYSFWDKDMIFISGKAFLDTSLSSTNKNGFIAVPSNAKYMKFASSINGTTDYTKATVTGDLPLRSLPNGVCDTLNLVTGEYVQRVGEVVLDGSENWLYGQPDSGWNQNGTATAFYAHGILSDKLRNGISVCDRMVTAQGADITSYITMDIECFGLSHSLDFVAIRKKGVSTSEQLKAWLSQNPITVQYELATPIVRKLGFTAKGNFQQASLGDYDWGASPTSSYNTYTTRYRTKSASSLPIVYNTHLFSDDFHVRHFNIDAHQDYEYISNMEYGQYVNIHRNKLESDTVESFKKWLAHNPITVGYIDHRKSSDSYSNIHKPIFFNNVNVKFLENNINIQPELTLQARTMNSYIMDMMKPNTTYTMKCLAYSNSAKLNVANSTANTSVSSNKTLQFAQSHLDGSKNGLVLVGQWYEPMIIEGDVTGKNLPYFKGILSSYHDVDEIELYSVNKNLFDMSKVKPYVETGAHWWNTIIKENEVVSVRSGNIEAGQFGAYATLDIRPNSVYTLYIEMEKDGEPFNGQIYVYENDKVWGNGTFAGYANTMYHLRTSQNAKYITIGFNYGKDFPIGTTFVSKNMRLYLGEESPVYIPHSHNTTLIEMPTRLETVKVVRPVMEEGMIDTTNGVNMDSTTSVRSDYIPVQPNEFIHIKNGLSDRLANIICYDINKAYINHLLNAPTQNGYVPKDCYFVRMHCGKSACSDLTITRQAYKPIQLNSLPNGVCDEIIMKPNSNKAQLVQRVGKVVLDGSESWTMNAENSTNISTLYALWIQGSKADSRIYCDKMTENYLTINSNDNQECIALMGVAMYLRLYNDRIIKNYLQQNPLTVYYELTTPIIHEIQLKGYPHVYENGTVTLNTDTPHQTLVSYNVNQEQLINTQNETIIRHDQQIDDLYYYIEMYLEEIYQMELFRMKLELSL